MNKNIALPKPRVSWTKASYATIAAAFLAVLGLLTKRSFSHTGTIETTDWPDQLELIQSFEE